MPPDTNEFDEALNDAGISPGDDADAPLSKEQGEKMARAMYALREIHRNTQGELRKAHEQIDKLQTDMEGGAKKQTERKLALKDHRIVDDKDIDERINKGHGDAFDDDDYSPVKRILHDTRSLKRMVQLRETERDYNRVGFARGSDQLYWMSTIAQAQKNFGDPKLMDSEQGRRALTALVPRTMKRFFHFGEAAIPEFERTMATDVELADWMPEEFSQRMIETARMAMKVASLFEEITMPTNPFKFPMEGTDLIAYLQAELTEDPDESTYGWPISKSVVAKLTLTAFKSACRSLFSDEAEEDALLAVLPYTEKKHGLAHAIAEENGLLNGQKTANIDTDVAIAPGATDFRKAWDGLRYIASQNKSATYDMSSITLSKVHALRLLMGLFGYNPAELAYITSLKGLFTLMSLTEVRTLDKIGPQAVILTGQLASLESIPVLASEYITSDMDATGFRTDIANDTYTAMLAVNKDRFLRGTKKGYTLKVLKEHYAPQGAVGVISCQRKAFIDIETATDTNVDVAYGVKMG